MQQIAAPPPSRPRLGAHHEERREDEAITQHVERSSQEQARGGKQITKSIESINEMVSQLNTAQREQTRGGEQILQAVEQLRELTRKQEEKFAQLGKALQGLSGRRGPQARA